MQRELRDFYDFNGNITNKTYFKGDPVPQGYYPMVVMVAIQNKKGEFLMQKRVASKGGDWGVTGGHPKHGETPIQGMITEIKEELGINVLPEKLEEFCSGCDGVDCFKMYYANLDLEISSLKIQKEELSEVKWFSIEKLQEMVKTRELNQNQITCFLKCLNYLKNQKKYYFKYQFPSNKEFISLFESVGWNRTEDRINKIRLNSCYSVCVYENNQIVGMGRVVGDGCYFTIYDIVVNKEKQSKGIGSLIIKEIINWYKTIKDDDTYLYCGASKNKEYFYEKFGFKVRPNDDVGAGMKWYE